MNRTVLALVIIGALNWLLIGLFQFDVVAAIFGGQAAIVSRIIYIIIGIAGIWAFTFFRKVASEPYSERYEGRRESFNYEFGKDDSVLGDRYKSRNDLSSSDSDDDISNRNNW